jgi:cytochrome o ubiquinol oxidase subunit 2
MKKIKILFLCLIPLLIIYFGYLYLKTVNIAVFNPKGEIALKEKNLILFALTLSLFVLVPVFVMLITFAIKYNEKNTKAKYSPNFDHSRIFESIWWGIPTILIIILSIVTWQSSHSLDPYKAINSPKPTLNIQVVSMDWKWLFIYPNSEIASVNDLTIPINTPVNLEITSDAPMNQLWIPQLAGQIMSMPGMVTHLNLIGNEAGTFRGMSSNISGQGFSGMTFNAHVVSDVNYQNWINSTRKSPNVLNKKGYQALNIHSEYVPATYYSYASPDLFGYIYNKYMSPSNGNINTGMGN